MASEPAVGTREDGSPPQRATAPSPSPRQPERPFSLNPPSSAAGDGSAKAGGGAGGGFQSPEGGPSLFPLPSPEASSPTGMADHAEQGDFGADHEDDLCRNGVVTGFAGQAPSINGTPGDPGIFGTELAPGVCGLPALAGSLSASKGAAVPAGAWGCAPPVSRGFKEEQDWCDSQEQLAIPGHGAACPRAVSPGVSAFHEPRVPKALASRRPEGSAGPMDLGDEALLPSLLEAAEEPPGQLASDEDPGPCSAASPGLEEGASSVSREHPSTSGAHAHSTPCPAAPGTKSGVVKDWASSEQDVEFQLQECQAVLGEISRSLDEVEGIDGLHMEKWRNQIAVIQKATKMPQTHIAVVGNMGSGKSSLLNALLDAEAVLPTSAMRACTAVVVEISRAAAGSPYEADVEFLSREEWYKELSALLEDMKDKAGNFKKRCPDRNTEAGAAYSRVKAVYGRVDELAKLEGMQEVTQYLGTVQHVAADTATDFRTNIERFINSRTDNLREMKGGEFWPVVKCVRIRIAKAEVLKTGAVLVDLPGIRDSNAARDKVAKEARTTLVT
ncbi:collagen alpha-1(I) chain-like [Elgaria multicarinata webbii]|uniref:collagen alpha-1(I) chain-like n=1 Tax=Elgaria multicarinata webbii TaxID=159646 RepID=UPI002FCD4A1E